MLNINNNERLKSKITDHLYLMESNNPYGKCLLFKGLNK